MQITQEKIEALVSGLNDTAKRNRERKGYKGELAPCAIVVGPQSEHSVLPLPWRNDDEKRTMMLALSATARQMNVAAIAIISNTRFVDGNKFADYFHIGRIEDIGLEAFKKEYQSITVGVYGGSIANLPRAVWQEAVIVACKGPLIQSTIRTNIYDEGPNDTIHWIKEDTEPEGLQMLMLPDWWDKTPTM
jgi:hypothetical protein